MATATDTYAKVEEKVTDLVTSVQEPVVANFRKVADLAESRINELSLPAVDSLPSAGELIGKADELVEKYFEFAQSVLDKQHELAKQLLDTLSVDVNKAKNAASTAKSHAKTGARATKSSAKNTTTKAA
jgi:hypothetical protein